MVFCIVVVVLHPSWFISFVDFPKALKAVVLCSFPSGGWRSDCVWGSTVIVTSLCSVLQAQHPLGNTISQCVVVHNFIVALYVCCDVVENSSQ